ncbi:MULTISPECIES: response regulator transcription factor [Pseudomonas]|nr:MULTISPECIES: response regulator transcription factor [Pseudomonas]
MHASIAKTWLIGEELPTHLFNGRTMNNQVVIVDDHPAIRMTLRLLLETEGYEIVGEAENGAQAMNLIQALQPGTVILDLGLPKVDGLTVLNRLTALRLPVKVIVLTAQVSDSLAIQCMQAGAHGFVNKHKELCELVNAIQAVANGHNYFPDGTFCLPLHKDSNGHNAKLLSTLSTRELRVLQQLAQGLSNKQIAERMLLSRRTISTYKTQLLVKLNTSNLLDLYGLTKRNGSAGA